MRYSISSPAGEFSIEADDLSLVARGGVADVFKDSFSNFAYKIFKDATVAEWEKIDFQIENPVDSDTGNADAALNFAWPVGLIYSENSRVGIVLPLIDLSSFISLDNWVESHLLDRLEDDNNSLGRRIPMLANLARILARLHRKGHAVIDLKPTNILVNRLTADVCLIDCDSFSIKSETQIFAPTHVSAGYIAPEALGEEIDVAVLDKHQDLFAFAAIAFQILNYGLHPFQGILENGSIADTTDDKAEKGFYAYGVDPNENIRPLPQSVQNQWPTQLRRLFDRAFTQSTNRPSARVWETFFNKLLSEKKLRPCDAHPTDPRHIRFEDCECMVCHRNLELKSAQMRHTVEASNREEHLRERIPTSPAEEGPNFGGLILFLLAVAAIIFASVLGSS